MNKILVAVDFSSHTAFSCSYALDLAIINKAEILLFHTYSKQFFFAAPSMPDAYEIGPFSNAELNLEAEEMANQQINSLQKELTDKAKLTYDKPIKISTHITNGDFEEDLRDFCNDYHPSVVIVGSKGKGESSSLFGNTAIRIFNRLKYPVLAIPDIEHSKNFDKIMYIADLEFSNDILIRKTFNLMENSNPKIYCVHLAEDNDYLKSFSSKEFLNSEYSKEINNNKFQVDVLEGTDKQEEIDKFIKDNQINMIAIMPHKANLFQRLIGQNKTKKYLFETNLPILAIRL